jgi:HAD superfamily hydrolase (TIGR01509 family)
VQYSALFLDFDGLICDTERAAYRSWQELYQTFGLTFSEAVWQTMTGNSNGERVAVDDLSARLGRPLGALELSRRRQRKYQLCGQEPLRGGVSSLLERAAGLGLRLAVVSSSPRTWLRPHLARLGIGDRFHLIVAGDDAPRHKPAPDLYRLALKRANLSAPSVLAFEDSAHGVQAAKRAGLACVAVPSEVGSRASVTAADLVLDSLTEFRLESLKDR